ncbi:MAG: TIGR00159 family protein [Bacteroidetes bacterium]|nr:TIGR00159 family protein [Bacteroidota bacterium]MBL6942980.1 TIGR00159 family protein [Bacteroidales bacterium]
MNLLFIDIRFLDFVDVFLVALLLYTLLKMLKGTVAINIFFGIVALFLIWKLVAALQMELLSEILGAFISVGLVALIIIFQPEIRQFLLALGTPSFFNKYGRKFKFLNLIFKEKFDFDIDPIIVACHHMAEQKTGALIVITRQNELSQYVNTGQVINASISTHIIENIFFKNSPLHDGAMIITGNKIRAAGCIIPVTKKQITARVGLRHRAAIGISEVSDCIAIIVSEETGKISYSIKGEMKYRISIQRLQLMLIEELGLESETKES